MEKNLYVAKGYKDRTEYLNSVAYEYGVSKSVIFELADLLGESEDFDGLLNEVEDIQEDILVNMDYLD